MSFLIPTVIEQTHRGERGWDMAPRAVRLRLLSGSTYLETRPAIRSFLWMPRASAARDSLATALAGRRT